MVPFEMVTKQRLRDKPEQASLSLRPGGGCLERTRGFANKRGSENIWWAAKMVTLGRLKGRVIPEQIQPSLCYRRKKQLMFSTDVSEVLAETQ